MPLADENSPIREKVERIRMQLGDWYLKRLFYSVWLLPCHDMRCFSSMTSYGLSVLRALFILIDTQIGKVPLHHY